MMVLFIEENFFEDYLYLKWPSKSSSSSSSCQNGVTLWSKLSELHWSTDQFLQWQPKIWCQIYSLGMGKERSLTQDIEG